MERAGRAGVLLVLAALPACSDAVAPPPAASPPVAVPAPAPYPTPRPALLPDPAPEPWETEKDPVRARTMKLETEWRLDPAFTDLKLKFFDVRPALVALEEGGPGGTEALAERAARTLAAGAEGFRAFLEDAGVGAPRLEDMKDTRLRMMVFRSRETFDAWHIKNGLNGRPNPYFSRAEPMLRVRADDLDSRACLVLGTYALLHEYRFHFMCEDDAEWAKRAGAPVEVPTRDDHRMSSAIGWFDRGFAEYIASWRPPPDGSGPWAPGPPDPHGTALLKFMRGQGMTWRLEELLFADRSQIEARARVKGGGTGMGEEFEGLARVQGALLFRYLLEGENGRRRPEFFRLVNEEMHARSGKAYLLKSFGFGTRGDSPEFRAWMAEVEKGYLAYAESLK